MVYTEPADSSVDFQKFRIFCTKLLTVSYILYETTSSSVESLKALYILYETTGSSVDVPKVRCMLY
jgi:hypothetical protein